MTVAVGLGEYVVGRDVRDTWVIHGIGSCVGLVLFDPGTRVSGLAHVVLPKAVGADRDRPAKYGETVVPFLIGEMRRLGADVRRIGGYVVGGAKMLTLARLGDIGARNVEAVTKSLDAHGIPVFAARVGGARGCTLRWEASKGRVVVCRAGLPDELLGEENHATKGARRHGVGVGRR